MTLTFTVDLDSVKTNQQAIDELKCHTVRKLLFVHRQTDRHTSDRLIYLTTKIVSTVDITLLHGSRLTTINSQLSESIWFHSRWDLLTASRVVSKY